MVHMDLAISRNSPFMVLMTSEACSGLVKVMKPKPQDCRVFRPLTTTTRPEAAEVIFQSLLISVEVEASNEELPFFRGHGREFKSWKLRRKRAKGTTTAEEPND
ncbi:hypothetical protein PAL_GLEAN10003592 [Pteropus alecto]|uniref:Uncharacterized protein n=1 Tax=Pteropus alecto TaxID=9402 RepID=L5K7I7_PTEAL|nr:hypothetical protein PAL_GLEAN10003592 [Pteropus alecto]